MENRNLIAVEVVYALPDKQTLLSVTLKMGSTIHRAIIESGLLTACPELVIENLSVGIFGEARRLSDVVKEGDRIEIYRSLKIDPKEARKKRAL